jgi:hypothetical protein
LGESVAIPDGCDEGCRGAGVDLVGGEGDHELLPIRQLSCLARLKANIFELPFGSYFDA